MAAATYTMTLPGAMLEHGFWLYVWRVEAPVGELLYVGRTGDSSSPHAKPPYQRMGQHLGRQKNQNALRRHLENEGVAPEQCEKFQLVMHGPLFPPATNTASHEGPRDKVAALEKALADALASAGYKVLNKVHSKKKLDEPLFASVRAAFAGAFPELLANRVDP